jgi:uncharacterized protein
MNLARDETKRINNFKKHRLDFIDTEQILNSRYCLDVMVWRNGEKRVQSFSYVMNQLAVLTVVYLERDNTYRIISFRTASKIESEVYYEWLANQSN